MSLQINPPKAYIYIFKDRECAGYLPYYCDDPQHPHSNIYAVTTYFGLPTDRKEGNVSYTYDFRNNVYEVGILCRDLESTKTRLREIEQVLRAKGCVTYEHAVGEDKFEVSMIDPERV
jgi:hypothetical protein